MTDWRMLAACATVDPELWMSPRSGQQAKALKICAGCDVLEQCAQWAATLDEPMGVIGGHYYGMRVHAAPPWSKHRELVAAVAERTARGDPGSAIAEDLGVTHRTVTRCRAELAEELAELADTG